MPLYQSSFYPDLSSVIFYDDFIGAGYNTRLWAVTGTGSITPLSQLGGRIQIRANAGASYRLNHGNNGGYAVSTKAQVFWYGGMTPATAANGKAECGQQGVTNPTTAFMCWRYQPNTSANFRCICASGGSTNDQDSGVIGDNNDHLFQIEAISGQVQFFLDGVLRQTLATFITAENLQPFVNCTGSAAGVSDFNADWVTVRGTRT